MFNRKKIVLLCTAFSLLCVSSSHCASPKMVTKKDAIVIIMQRILLMQELKSFQKVLVVAQGSVSKAIEQFDWKRKKITFKQLRSMLNAATKGDIRSNECHATQGNLGSFMVLGLAVALMSVLTQN